MRTIFRSILDVAAAAMFLFASVSCQLDSPDPAPSGEAPVSCEVTIRLSEAPSPSDSASARTILPAAPASPAAYAFEGVGPEGSSLSVESADPWLRTRLAPGDWSVSVRALNAEGLVLLVGSASFGILPGSAADVSVPLSPRDGLGSVRLDFAMPPGLPAGAHLAIDLEPLSGGPLIGRSVASPFSVLELFPVPSGYHCLTARLLDAADQPLGAGFRETVRVLPDVATSALLDFASVPGSVSISAIPASAEPLVVRLPAWHAVSADEQFPLEARTDSTASLSWSRDGLPIADSLQSISLQPGFRRIDALASFDGGRRGGSAGMLLEALPGVSAGPLRWVGDFSPTAADILSLPACHGFADSDGSSDGRVFAALDAPPPGADVSGSATRSALHLFSVTDRGSPFFLGALPIRSSGTARSCDRMRLSPDGASFIAWNGDSSWLVYGSTEIVAAPADFAHLDAESLSLSASLSVKDAAFSADGGALFVLSGPAPYRVVCVVSDSGAPRVSWTALADDPLVSGLAFHSLAVHASGAMLLLSATSDAALLFAPPSEPSLPPSIAAAYRRTQTGPSWLDGPRASCPRGGIGTDAEFLFVCAESESLGRIGIDADGLPFIGALAEAVPELACADAARVSPDGLSAAFRTETGICVFPLDGGSQSFLPAAGRSSIAWIASSRLFAADAYSRSVSSIALSD